MSNGMALASSIKQKEDFRMFASKLFRKAAIAGLAAALLGLETGNKALKPMPPPRNGVPFS